MPEHAAMPARSPRVGLGDRGRGGKHANVLIGEGAHVCTICHQVTIPVKERPCSAYRVRRLNRLESRQLSAGRCSTRKQLVARPAAPKIMHMTNI